MVTASDLVFEGTTRQTFAAFCAEANGARKGRITVCAAGAHTASAATPLSISTAMDFNARCASAESPAAANTVWEGPRATARTKVSRPAAHSSP